MPVEGRRMQTFCTSGSMSVDAQQLDLFHLSSFTNIMIQHVHRISATVSAKKAVRMTGIHYVLCVAEVKGVSHFHNGK